MATKGKYDAVDAAYEFLVARAKDGTPFTMEELLKAAKHWKKATGRTYLTKWLKDYIGKGTSEKFTVRPEFASVKHSEFRNLQRQTKKVYQEYERRAYAHVVSFEFLLPLTRQDKLREALDRLFYQDTLIERVNELGVAHLQKIIPRPSLDIDDVAYKLLVAEQIGSMFFGYSIGHVSGRFRAASLMLRSEAWKHRYLVDEATAVVRFIIPCPSAKVVFMSPAELAGSDPDTHLPVNIASEASRIRRLFFDFFVEAIVRTIDKEDETWLMESGVRNQLYVWAKPAA